MKEKQTAKKQHSGLPPLLLSTGWDGVGWREWASQEEAVGPAEEE